MAFLLDTSTNQRCFLYAHHSFGRLTYAVDTVIERAQISKHHAIIEWHSDRWFIRDLSTNGTWLNKTKLVKDSRHPLNPGDVIGFASADNPSFTVADLSPPCDLLLPCDANATDDGIVLSQYHLLPDEQHPQVAIFLDRAQRQWCIEYLEQPDEDPIFLNEHDVIEFGHQRWQLRLSHLATATELLEDPPHTLYEVDFIFDLSPDEETTVLRLHTPEQTIDCHARSHHYLTLNLARYRASDAAKGIESAQQGWVYPEQLVRDIGIEISYLNIQIHRIRKQFTDYLCNICDAQCLIERQSGKLRFGGSLFKVYKGHQLECELPDCGKTRH